LPSPLGSLECSCKSRSGPTRIFGLSAQVLGSGLSPSQARASDGYEGHANQTIADDGPHSSLYAVSASRSIAPVRAKFPCDIKPAGSLGGPDGDAK